MATEKDARHEVVVGLLKTNQLNKVRRKKREMKSKKILYFEWSPPRHFKTARLDFVPAWSGQVKVDIQLICWNAFCYSQLRRLTGSNLLMFFLTYLLTFFLTYLLTFFLTYLFDIFSDKTSDFFFAVRCLRATKVAGGALQSAKWVKKTDFPTFQLNCKNIQQINHQCKQN